MRYGRRTLVGGAYPDLCCLVIIETGSGSTAVCVSSVEISYWIVDAENHACP